MLRRFLFLILFVFCFLGCDDTAVIKPLLEEAPSVVSRYTGELTRVGMLKNFGSNVGDAAALEWNGESLYMIAEMGASTSRGEYLFRLDKETGLATVVNGSAIDLGGSFRGGLSFTQVYGVDPWDMVWLPPPDGYEGVMLATCPKLRQIVEIDLETGFAKRLTRNKGYCLLDESRTTVFEEEVVLSRGIGFLNGQLYASGVKERNIAPNPRIVEIFLVGYNFRCFLDLPQADGAGIGPWAPLAMSSDGHQMYMAGEGPYGLYVLDLDTGKQTLVAEWYIPVLPDGYTRYDAYYYHHIESNTMGRIDITGLAFDGEQMYAVDHWTNALYVLETW